MTKKEFIEALALKLSEELDAAETASQIRYYEGYLDGEVARGHTEEEAVEALGDPNLIAKTIIEMPREDGFFGRTVPSESDSYYEGAFQAENEPGVSYGYHEENNSYGYHEENSSYGTREESASYGTREESASYGTREEGTSYGDREESASYGTREESTSYGTHEDSMSYGTRGDEDFTGGPRHAAFEENVRGTVETSKRGLMRDENGDFNWSLFALILAAVMIFVAIIWFVTRVIFILWPVILIVIAVSLITRAFRGSGR